MLIRLVIVALLSMVLSSITNTLSMAQQPSIEGKPIEFREIHPDARKVLVDEITIQLKAEQQKQFDDVLRRAENWAQIASGTIGVFVALLAILGWRGLANIRSSVKSDVQDFISSDPSFTARLNSQIEGSMRNVARAEFEKTRREISLARLEYVAERVSEADSFTHGQRDMMIDLITSVSSDPTIRSTPSFVHSAAAMMRSFTAAHLDQYVDDMEDSFRDIFIREYNLAKPLINHYGERMLEAAEPVEKLKERFQTYVDATKRLKVYELAVPYLLATEHSAVGKSKARVIDNLLKEVAYMSDQERDYIVRMCNGLSDPERSVTAFRLEQEKSKFQAFMVDYGERINDLASAANVTNAINS